MKKNRLKKHKYPRYRWLIAVLVILGVAYISRYQWLPTRMILKSLEWQTITGKKNSSFLPEVQMRYGPVDDCGQGEIEQIIPAEETDAGKTYRIHYPLKLRYKGCLYGTGGAKLYMEEKNDDPRLINDPNYARNKTRRRNLTTGGEIGALLFISDDYADNELDPNRNFIDTSPLDIYCYRIKRQSSTNQGMVNTIYCGTSAGQKKPLMFIYYSQRFVQSGQPVVINLKVSQKTYCYMFGKLSCLDEGETELPQIPRNFRDFITPDWFSPFYEEENPNAR